MTPLGLLLVLTAAVAHAIWNFLVKRLNGGPELLWLFAALPLVIYGPLALYLAATWQGDLSVVYCTARATGPVLPALLAFVFLGQALPPQAAVGGAIIVFGVAMLAGGLCCCCHRRSNAETRCRRYRATTNGRS